MNTRLRRGRGGGRRRQHGTAASNPLGGLTNLADLMLVFAVALMVAVVLLWHVDLRGMTVLDERELIPADDLEQLLQDGSGAGDYESAGRIYTDPVTGRMYVVPE
ncbi:MAG: hypothetical protein LBS10_10290 [Gracilibacteraceae bacterium]|jgi:hypothetical protein|nr:hypothetical protein [Gracilibacteraceae bacterium]